MVRAEPAQIDAEPGEPTRRTLQSRVFEQLRRLIDRGEFPKDFKLPTEAELGTRFGVSRVVVRGALMRLREAGYIRSLQGSGSVVVRGPAFGALVYPAVQTIGDLERLYEFRITVEAQSAELAARMHTPETLEVIEDALREADKMVELGTPELAADLNFRFHRAVALATGNPYFIVTLERIPNLIGFGRVQVKNFGIEDPVERLRGIGADHWSIYEAIRARDAQRARAEMESHIGAARKYIFERQPIAE
ncbi:MAG: FadR family transcriptional regulator [Proteobacteria bacterium]|nr:FadR family transcriptional regulator [Pseudomonadota bacterium]